MYIYIVAVFLMVITTLLLPSLTTAQTTETAVLRWAVTETPGSIPDKNDIRTPCEVNDIAVASDLKTIYAIDIPYAGGLPVIRPGIWKSMDGGINWSPRATMHLCQAIPVVNLPVMDIAVAPDNPDFVAAVCLNNLHTLRTEVYFTDDGGTNWFYTGVVPWVYGGGEQIGDIAISPGYPSNQEIAHDIIIGSRNPASGVADGEIYAWSYPGFYGWEAQDSLVGDAIAINVSPNYAEDFSLVVMASTTQRTYISLGYRDSAANSCAWNIDAGWPVELCEPAQTGGIFSGEDRIITGNIALPVNFMGTLESQRLIFAAYDSNNISKGENQILDDVYRLNNTIVTRLRLPGAGNTVRVSSIAYAGDNDSGKLIAGEVAADLSQASARTWICLDPLPLCPTWQLSLKPPTGGGKDGFANARLAWSADGSTAYCGTGSGNRNTPQKWADPTNPAWNGQPLDESAISVSVDDGFSWNQVGLIDTEISRLRGLAVANDQTNIFLGSVNDHGFDSLWRSQSPVLGEVWQRVMCFSGESSLVKLSPDAEDGSNVFWANQGTSQARSSTDFGQTWHECLPDLIVEDIALQDAGNLYILQANGDVRHGTCLAGWTWSPIFDTGLNVAHTIAANGDFVLVGASINESSPIAYSSDKGQSWLKITTQTPTTGNRHVAFDTYFETDQIIYVADDAGGIYRWSLGRSSAWDDLAPPDHSFYSIHLSGDGPIYGAFSFPDSGVDRALYPRSGVPKPGVNWDSLSVGLAANVRFSSEPDAMDVSKNTLWAIDARDYNILTGVGRLWAFTDTLAGSGLHLLSPAYGTSLGCDPVSGRNQDIDLAWEQLSLADAYEFEIAKDEDFNLRISEAEPATNPYYGPPSVTNPAYRILPGVLPEANTTYYWRVRVRQAATGQVIRSYWSDTGSFNIKAGLPVAAPYPGAQALRPEHGACNVPVSFVAFSWTPFKETTAYRFVLAGDSALSEIIVEEELPTTAYKYNGRLDYETGYFWQVTGSKPLPSEPSPVFSFTTVAEPPPPQAPTPLYQQLLQWLQISVLINVFSFVGVAALTVLFSRHRK